MGGGPDVDVPTTGPSAGSEANGTYTVKAGDTLYSIARDHDVSYSDLLKWNDIQDPNTIVVGQEIRLAPSGS
ncbi:MAG: LysM peptidoglycan-binding domain-containing protein [Alphaproteobacteria bacterium]|nr:LysM peptidoglycan-binding domain-containing protein [Alphaproteobacteria bacterium]